MNDIKDDLSGDLDESERVSTLYESLDLPSIKRNHHDTPELVNEARYLKLVWRKFLATGRKQIRSSMALLNIIIEDQSYF